MIQLDFCEPWIGLFSTYYQRFKYSYELKNIKKLEELNIQLYNKLGINKENSNISHDLLDNKTMSLKEMNLSLENIKTEIERKKKE